VFSRDPQGYPATIGPVGAKEGDPVVPVEKLLQHVVKRACLWQKDDGSTTTTTTTTTTTKPCKLTVETPSGTTVSMDVAAGSIGWLLAVLFGLGHLLLVVLHLTGRVKIQFGSGSDNSSSNSNNADGGSTSIGE